jgi:hypothetical protein
MPSYKGQRTTTTVRSQSKGAGQSNTTSFIQVKNLSTKDQMAALDLSYVDSSSNKKLVHLTDLLQPQKTFKLDFVQAGLSAQVVQVRFSWKFEGIKYESSQTAKLGSYYYSLKASFEADGSEETYFSIQKPIA